MPHVDRSLEDKIDFLIRELNGFKWEAEIIRRETIDQVMEMIDETRLDRNLIRAKLQAMK